MLTAIDLAGFTGTEKWYRHWTDHRFIYTDGIKYLADHGGEDRAYWLINAIFSHQSNPSLRTPGLQEFQLWELKVNNGTAVLTCRPDSNMPALVVQEIDFTDFTFDIKLYVEGDGEHLTLLLPSEH